MANSSSYRAQVDATRIAQIRAICRELPQACGDFLRGISTTTGTFTRLAYALDLRTFFRFMEAERITFQDKKLTLLTDTDLGLLSQSDLVAYTEYLQLYYRDVPDDESGKLGRETVNHELAIKRKLCSIRSFYDYLFQNKRIETNVTLLVPLPKIHEKPIIRLSASEMERILLEAENGKNLTKKQQDYQKKTARRDFAMLSLFLGTGIRVSECVGLNLTDIDMDEKAFLVTRKGGNQVVLYFPDEVATALTDYITDRETIDALPGHEDALFLSLQRRRITQRAVQNLVKKYARVAAPLKQKISPHKLRSTFATNLYQESGDIYLVADVLGHSSVDTTRKHYADMTDARRRSATSFVHLPKETEEASQRDASSEDEDSSSS